METQGNPTPNRIEEEYEENHGDSDSMDSRQGFDEEDGDELASTHFDVVKDLCCRAVTSKAEWPNANDFLDVILWGRQLLGILLGLICALVPIEGIFGVVFFVAISFSAVYLYAFKFQNIDKKAAVNTWMILKIGYKRSFAAFLFSWVVFHNGWIEEEALASMVM